MKDTPLFRKHDRYKVSSYRSYIYKMPERYDSLFWMSFCQIPLWDRMISAEIGDQIGSLAILDVGCATGRLLSTFARAGATRLHGTDLEPNILEVAREKLAGGAASAELCVADKLDVNG
jgi:ubiquinone/menaquinone biosynthesis C-methylase UbiE